MTQIDNIKNSKIYGLLHELPKGVLHHIHIDCCEDVEFVSDAIVFSIGNSLSMIPGSILLRMENSSKLEITQKR